MRILDKYYKKIGFFEKRWFMIKENFGERSLKYKMTNTYMDYWPPVRLACIVLPIVLLGFLIITGILIKDLTTVIFVVTIPLEISICAYLVLFNLSNQMFVIDYDNYKFYYRNFVIFKSYDLNDITIKDAQNKQVLVYNIMYKDKKIIDVDAISFGDQTEIDLIMAFNLKEILGKK